ncbi:unnamed protein product [Urochloa humidicola]
MVETKAQEIQQGNFPLLPLSFLPRALLPSLSLPTAAVLSRPAPPPLLGPSTGVHLPAISTRLTPRSELVGPGIPPATLPPQQDELAVAAAGGSRRRSLSVAASHNPDSLDPAPRRIASG